MVLSDKFTDRSLYKCVLFMKAWANFCTRRSALFWSFWFRFLWCTELKWQQHELPCHKAIIRSYHSVVRHSCGYCS